MKILAVFSNGVVIHKKFDQTTQKKHPFPTKLGEVPTQFFFPLIGLDILCLHDWDLPKKIIPKNLAICSIIPTQGSHSSNQSRRYLSYTSTTMSVYPIVIEIQILLLQRVRQIPEPKKIHSY